MKSLLVSCLILFLAYSNATSQKSFPTTAEKSDFKSTSTYEDVKAFIKHLTEISDYIKVETIATSVEGRDIPLLIIGDPLPKGPEDMADDNRVVVYVQANIHAGEVEGKEAVLMYARDLLSGTNRSQLDNTLILLCPLFNPDGNEKISTSNRTSQNGPLNGVGVRHNAQYLDLNRDAMKAESSEVRGVLENVFKRWDPSVFMDCHTTNGSFHREPVTFTWMVNPNGDNTLISYMQSKMAPAMSGILMNRYNVENCFYGEFIDMLNMEKGWILDASDPRYMSNYFGLRNRLGILNENYVYADFRTRIFGCYYLIHSLIDYTSAHNLEIKKLLKAADDKTIARGMNPAIKDSFAIEYKVRPAKEMVTINAFEADIITAANGRRDYKQSERLRKVTVPYYIDFYPSVSVKFPFAYLLNINDQKINSLLKAHGIKAEKLTIDSELEVERFEINELKGALRLNQGHYTNTIKGRFIKEKRLFSSGTIIVRTAQPLANVAAYLLEPQSNDGLMTWNFLDNYLVPQWGIGYNSFPVFKVMNSINLNTVPLW